MLRRLSAALIALAVLVALVWQFHINAAKPGLAGPGIRLWLMLRYFTNFANGLVAVQMGLAAMERKVGGRKVGPDLAVTAALSIAMTGIVYQLFIALPEPMPAPHWYPDFLLHRAVPVASLSWWLAFADKGLRLSRLPLWLLPPLLYCPYALLRGAETGIWPYRFLDVTRLGAGAVGLNVLGLLAAFAALGAGFWAVARSVGKPVFLQ